MFERSQTWTKLVAYFLEIVGLKFGKSMTPWWNMVNNDHGVICFGLAITSNLLVAKGVGLRTVASLTEAREHKFLAKGDFPNFKGIKLGE